MTQDGGSSTAATTIPERIGVSRGLVDGIE
jgi:hypothetical protein